MNKKIEKISKDFSSIQWHDSKVLSFQILQVQNSSICKIIMDLYLPHKFNIEDIQTNHCKVIYNDCSFLGCNLDLFYLMWGKMNIDYAKFYRKMSEIQDEGILQKIKIYSNKNKKYEDEMCFYNEFMVPGGEIIVVARDFKIKGLKEFV